MSFRNQVVDFVEAFNVDDLDKVMSFFADTAEYCTYDGRRCEGKAAIRKEFSAQFQGRYGQLRFIKDKIVIDEAGQMAAVTWRCEHGLPGGSSSLFTTVLQRNLGRIMGKKPFWEGVDIFRFNNGLLAGKYTYAQSRVPLFRRGN